MLHISFLHELGWRCQKVPIGGQKHLESRGCQVFYGLRLQVVWAARCLHGVPSGKDRHAAASFACEGPAACTQPLMYCECTVRVKLDQTWVEAVLSTARKAVSSAELPRSSLLLWALSCALQVVAACLTLSVRENVKSEGLWLKVGACCHWVESGNLPLSFLNNCLMASEPLNFWRNAKSYFNLQFCFKGFSVN